MPLTLTIRNADALDNGSPLSLILDRRGAIIGRAPTTDWCLPDPNLYISSRHCEVQFRDGGYVLTDISTNGTFLHGNDARLPGPHPIAQGDCFVVGRFEITAALDDATAATMAERNAAPPPPQWQGWNAHRGADAAAAAAHGGQWDAPKPGAAISGTGPMSQAWSPPAAETPSQGGGGEGWASAPAEATPAPSGSGWGDMNAPAAPASRAAQAPAVPPPPRSNWGSPTPTADPDAASPFPAGGGWSSASRQPAADAAGWGASTRSAPGEGSTWGASSGPALTPASDWSSGFGAPPPPPVAATPLAPSTVAAAPPARAPTDRRPSPSRSAAASDGAGLDAFLTAAGLTRDKLKQGESESLGQAGRLLRSLISGLVVLLEARARAKGQLGAQGTSLEFDGNNPLKFARTPEQALAQLLNPAERGFMQTERAVEDSFRDLQAHQMATLKAMQGALKSTLDRFSPQAIRARATQGGVMSKILPGARDAALWAAYEREFSGVAQGSDEAFMDVFAKEFRRAYEEAARKP